MLQPRLPRHLQGSLGLLCWPLGPAGTSSVCEAKPGKRPATWALGGVGARRRSSPGGSLSLAECSAAPALFLLLGPQVLLHPFPCALPRNITGNKNQRPSRPFLPGSHIRIRPWPHLPRPLPSSWRGYTVLGGSMSSRQKCNHCGPLGTGTATSTGGDGVLTH